MRAFKKHEDIATKIAYEMVNIEGGKYKYDVDKGCEGNGESYPVVKLDGMTTSIKSSYGFIYVPANCVYTGGKSSFMSILRQICSVLDELDAEHNHLSQYKKLNRRNHSHFTVMKGKSMRRGTRVVSDFIELFSSHHEARTISLQPFYGKDEGEYKLTRSDFIWYVAQTETLIANVFGVTEPSIPKNSQLISILYDVHDWFNLRDGEKLDNNMLPTHFRLYNTLLENGVWSCPKAEIALLENDAGEDADADVDADAGEDAGDVKDKSSDTRCMMCKKNMGSYIALATHYENGKKCHNVPNRAELVEKLYDKIAQQTADKMARSPEYNALVESYVSVNMNRIYGFRASIIYDSGLADVQKGYWYRPYRGDRAIGIRFINRDEMVSSMDHLPVHEFGDACSICNVPLFGDIYVKASRDRTIPVCALCVHNQGSGFDIDRRERLARFEVAMTEAEFIAQHITGPKKDIYLDLIANNFQWTDWSDYFNTGSLMGNSKSSKYVLWTGNRLDFMSLILRKLVPFPTDKIFLSVNLS